MLKIYNTLKRQKEEFIPLKEKEVSMYTCGPTVYDFFHIGNARSFINADFVRRYLEYSGYKVKFIMNLTDIDDKIIRRANAEDRSAESVATEYSKAFLEDIKHLNVKKATLYPKATHHMGEIIEMIEKLVQKGIAYATDDGVYYNVEKFPGYGKLSGKNTEDLQEGARVEVNELKQSPLDFALWKKAKPGEPFWPSPWGDGRPGWHIECSAMSCKHLGETFDIHTGGSDLVFPHHENEIAQSEAATGKPFVRYWMHYGFLNIDNEKMSKSLGNFKTARDMFSTYSAESIRFLFAQRHYTAPLDFTEQSIQSAATGLQRLQNLFERLTTLLSAKTNGETPELSFKDYEKAFSDAMDDDFNSPKAMGVLFDFVSEVNQALVKHESPSLQFVKKAHGFIKKTAGGVFGILKIQAKESGNPELEDKLIGLMLTLRTEMKLKKDFQTADLIRNELQKLGIVLQDSKDGTTFKKQ
ncbi:MAG: cysteine--tRNA ligase [Ignavibacteriales bacterium]|nr:cysteine--tRNA ligase [Ignavibacteriales bacterium]